MPCATKEARTRVMGAWRAKQRASGRCQRCSKIASAGLTLCREHSYREKLRKSGVKMSDDELQKQFRNVLG